MPDFILIAIGAVLGANARYWLSNWFARRYGPQFPWGTLFINISGSLAIGVVLGALHQQQALDASLRLLLATGFCGGYTTFSTFSYETMRLIQEGEYRAAIFNATTSVLACLLASFAGIVAGGWLP